METLNETQKRFFETFGYLAFKGLLAEEMGRIIAEFEGVFEQRGITHDPTQRSCLVPFIDQREYLCGLLDHPSITMIAQGLLGDNYNYLGSDGNYYTGNTGWHSDGYHRQASYIKIALYLDPVKADTGALRVIPGSHRLEPEDPIRRATRSKELWGIEAQDVPAVALESQPGDVVVFNHNIMHSSYGGSSHRRMFTINLGQHSETAEELLDLENYINSSARFWIDSLYGPLMLKTAPPQRMAHLQQVLDHQTALPALAAKARLEMAGPARS